MDELLLGLGIFIVILAVASSAAAAWACHMAVKANIAVCGLQNSTHQVQYVPFEPDAGDLSDPDREVRRGERAAFDAAGDLSDETFHS
jgi:hypothetical protein